MDKQTGRPTTDPEAIERFTRKLTQLTADQSAAFIGYDPEGGTWRFRVEHFSRWVGGWGWVGVGWMGE